MGKASTSKKVARAARTGGGRTARGARPLQFYAVMTIVVVLGVALIVLSRQQRRQEFAASATREAPFEQGSKKKPAGDHWHAAYGVYLCDQFAAPTKAGSDPVGIHTHGDGVIHIHPFVRAAAGSKATLSVFFKTVGMSVSPTKLTYNGKTYTEGKDDCRGKKGVVRTFVNGKELKTDPASYRPKDRDLIVFAFTAPGAQVPKDPPSKDTLDNLEDVPGGGPIQAPNTPAAGDTTATTAAGDTTATTAAGDTTATTAAGGSTTSAP